jgi:hypothetical protein
MMIECPTILRNVEIPSFIKDDILSNDSQIVGYLDSKQTEFDDWFSKIIGFKIECKDSWVNYTVFKDNILNDFDWHNEEGVSGSGNKMRGTYTGIIWINGDTDCGGNLGVIVNNFVETIDFQPKTVIVMTNETFHKVFNYTGFSTRISLNFTFDLV